MEKIIERNVPIAEENVTLWDNWVIKYVQKTERT